MKKTAKKEALKTIRIKGEKRLKRLFDVVDFISDTSGVDTDCTGAVNWLLKKFDDDKILP